MMQIPMTSSDVDAQGSYDTATRAQPRGQALESKEAENDIDAVFHNVAQVPLAKDRHLFWSVNCEGTENLLAIDRHGGSPSRPWRA